MCPAGRAWQLPRAMGELRGYYHPVWSWPVLSVVNDFHSPPSTTLHSYWLFVLPVQAIFGIARKIACKSYHHHHL